VYSPKIYSLIVCPEKPQPTPCFKDKSAGMGGSDSESLDNINAALRTENSALNEDGINILNFANGKLKSANNYLSTIASRYLENCKGKENIDHCFNQFLDELSYCLGTFDLIDILCIIFARVNQHVRLDNLRAEIAREIKLNELNSRNMFKFAVSIRNEIGSVREHVSPNSESRVVDPYFIESSNLSVFLSIELVDVIDEGMGLKLMFCLKYSAVLNNRAVGENEILYFEKLTSLNVESKFDNNLDNKQQSIYRTISNNPYYKFFTDFALDICNKRIKGLLKINK
jgi:hypothetical protein